MGGGGGKGWCGDINSGCWEWERGLASREKTTCSNILSLVAGTLAYTTTRSFETEMKHDIKLKNKPYLSLLKALGQSCWPPQLPARCPLLSSCRRARAVCQLAAVAPASCPATWLPLTLLLPWASLANCWSCPTTSQPPSPT